MHFECKLADILKWEMEYVWHTVYLSCIFYLTDIWSSLHRAIQSLAIFFTETVLSLRRKYLKTLTIKVVDQVEHPAHTWSPQNYEGTNIYWWNIKYCLIRIFCTYYLHYFCSSLNSQNRIDPAKEHIGKICNVCS